MSSSNSPFLRIATLRGGRTNRKFTFYWNKENHYIYQEVSGFFSTSKEKMSLCASSWEMSYHACEMWVASR